MQINNVKITVLMSVVNMLACPVFAQETTEPADSVMLYEVVVSATRTPHSIYAIPAKISIINRTLIDNSPVFFTDELLRGTGGVYVKRSKIADQTVSVSMRGFSGDSRTLVLLDGVPLNDGYTQAVNWSGVPVNAISRVEVVKGSFSSLYGGSAMGGVINILTEIPEEKAVTVKSSYGTYNTFDISTSYSNRFFENKKLGVFVSLTQKSSDGYASNFYQTTAKEGVGSITVTGWRKTTNNRGVEYFLLGDMGENWMKQSQLYGKISYDFSPRSKLDFSISSSINSYGYRDSHSFLTDETTKLPVDNGSITINDGGVQKTITVRPYNFLNGPGKGWSNTYKLYYKTALANEIRLTAYAGLVDDRNSYQTILSGATAHGGPGYISSTKPKQTYIASLQADIPLFNRAFLTVGADYKHYKAGNEEWDLANWRDENSKTTARSSMEGRQSIIAPFVQAEINIFDGLRGYLGVRYDYWQNVGGKSNTAAFDTTYANTTKGHLSPKAGLVYSPSAGSDIFKIKSVRASAGESFRTPTLYQLYRTWVSGTTTYASNPDLKPESAFSMEAGVSFALFGEATNISFDWFSSDIDDLLYSSEIATGIKKQMNAGKGKIRGFEAEIRQNICAFLDVNFNITKQNTEITANTAEPNSTGKRFTNVPDLLYNAGINIHKGAVNLVLTYNFTGKIYSASDNSDVVQGVYGSYDEQKLFDGKVSCKFKNINFSLSVNNIFDNQYYIYYLAPGRTYTVGVTGKF